MRKAVANDSLELVKLLATHFTGCHVPQLMMQNAMSHHEIAKWLVANRSDARWVNHAVTNAIRTNNLELAKWLNQRIDRTRHLSRWMEAAAEVEILEWVDSLSDGIEHHMALSEAVRHNQVEAAAWFVARGVLDAMNHSMFRDVTLERGADQLNFDVLQQFIHLFAGRCSIIEADCHAARHGRLDIVRLFHENRVPVKRRTERCCRSWPPRDRAVVVRASRGRN